MDKFCKIRVNPKYYLNILEFKIALLSLFFSNPTPDGVTLLDGIPKFLPYNSVNQSYMKIHENWEVKSDYTLTYTITVDELNPPAQTSVLSKRQSGHHQRSLTNKIN